MMFSDCSELSNPSKSASVEKDQFFFTQMPESRTSSLDALLSRTWDFFEEVFFHDLSRTPI